MAARKLSGLAWGFTASCAILGVVLVAAERQGDAVYAFVIGALAGIVALIASTRVPRAVEEDTEETARR